MNSHSSWLSILKEIEAEIAPELSRKLHLECHTGDWLDSAGLKIQKPSWTDGGPGQGVFFSVWLGDKDLRKGRFNYNIYALKLRLREGYAIKPRDFASAFREKFASQSGRWPNIRTDYGPQTLLQGWMPLDAETFREDVVGLVDSFVATHGIIDVLLEERRKS